MENFNIEPDETLDISGIQAPTERELLMQEFDLLFQISQEEADSSIPESSEEPQVEETPEVYFEHLLDQLDTEELADNDKLTIVKKIKSLVDNQDTELILSSDTWINAKSLIHRTVLDHPNFVYDENIISQNNVLELIDTLNNIILNISYSEDNTLDDEAGSEINSLYNELLEADRTNDYDTFDKVIKAFSIIKRMSEHDITMLGTSRSYKPFKILSITLKLIENFPEIFNISDRESIPNFIHRLDNYTAAEDEEPSYTQRINKLVNEIQENSSRDILIDNLVKGNNLAKELEEWKCLVRPEKLLEAYHLLSKILNSAVEEGLENQTDMPSVDATIKYIRGVVLNLKVTPITIRERILNLVDKIEKEPSKNKILIYANYLIDMLNRARENIALDDDVKEIACLTLISIRETMLTNIVSDEWISEDILQRISIRLIEKLKDIERECLPNPIMTNEYFELVMQNLFANQSIGQSVIEQMITDINNQVIPETKLYAIKKLVYMITSAWHIDIPLKDEIIALAKNILSETIYFSTQEDEGFNVKYQYLQNIYKYIISTIRNMERRNNEVEDLEGTMIAIARAELYSTKIIIAKAKLDDIETNGNDNEAKSRLIRFIRKHIMEELIPCYEDSDYYNDFYNKVMEGYNFTDNVTWEVRDGFEDNDFNRIIYNNLKDHADVIIISNNSIENKLCETESIIETINEYRNIISDNTIVDTCKYIIATFLNHPLRFTVPTNEFLSSNPEITFGNRYNDIRNWINEMLNTPESSISSVQILKELWTEKKDEIQNALYWQDKFNMAVVMMKKIEELYPNIIQSSNNDTLEEFAKLSKLIYRTIYEEVISYPLYITYQRPENYNAIYDDIMIRMTPEFIPERELTTQGDFPLNKFKQLYSDIRRHLNFASRINYSNEMLDVLTQEYETEIPSSLLKSALQFLASFLINNPKTLEDYQEASPELRQVYIDSFNKIKLLLADIPEEPTVPERREDIPSPEEFEPLLNNEVNFIEEEIKHEDLLKNVKHLQNVRAGIDDFSKWAMSQRFSVNEFESQNGTTFVYYKFIGASYFLIGRKVNFYINHYEYDNSINPINKHFVQDAIFWKYAERNVSKSSKSTQNDTETGELYIGYENNPQYIRSLPHSKIDDFDEINMSFCAGSSYFVKEQFKSYDLQEILHGMAAMTDARLGFENQEHRPYSILGTKEILDKKILLSPIKVFANRTNSNFISEPFILHTEMDKEFSSLKIKFLDNYILTLDKIQELNPLIIKVEKGEENREDFFIRITYKDKESNNGTNFTGILITKLETNMYDDHKVISTFRSTKVQREKYLIPMLLRTIMSIR